MKTINGNQGRKSKSPTTPETPKSRRLDLPLAGRTIDRATTDMAGAGIAANASLILKYSQAEHGEMSLTDMVNTLTTTGEAANRNDLGEPERLLAAQVSSLNAIYCELARRAAVNMGEYMDATERYMRLALKAQSQCRATVETLAAIKNAPIVYAKQANVSHGPQQVNNAHGAFSDVLTNAPVQAENRITPNKLFEGVTIGSETLDAGTARETAECSPALEAVEKIDRPQKRCGKSAR